jgi:lipocalin
MNIVEKVDLERYAGTWYEIARFPHSFEKNLVGVTATYTLRPDGKVDVLNKGYKNSLDGKLKTAKAFAKVPDPGNTGRLKVFFFWPFGADYLILELDQENYQYALVGSSTSNYLWILSRTPQMDQDIYDMLVSKALERGYDVSRIEKVPQIKK